MRALFDKLKKLSSLSLHRKDLDSILSHAPSANSSLKQRMAWLADLLQWVRSEGTHSAHLDFSTGSPQANRVKLLLNVLDRHPDWKSQVGLTIGSIFKEASLKDLLLNTGISEHESFLPEAFERFVSHLLPHHPFDHEISHLFEACFQNEKDFLWMLKIDENVLEQFLTWIEEFNSKEVWNGFKSDSEQALLFLSIHLRSLGINHRILSRSTEKALSKQAFFRLSKLTEQWIETADPDHKLVIADQIRTSLKSSQRILNEVLTHLDEYGVDIPTVYLIDRIESLQRRFELLFEIMASQSRNTTQILHFIMILINDNIESRSVSALFSDVLSLISRKIAERSAETGEHYITRNWEEFKKIFRKALGGGAVTALTTLVKFGVTAMSLPGFIGGLFASLNYAISFLGIHFLGYTLATKQPAMTATALANKMGHLKDENGMEDLISEIVHLLRTQIAGIIGNVVAVFPVTALICYAYFYSSKTHLISQEKALYTLDSFSILGSTPILAAITGVLLWFSSIIAGWCDNWFVSKKLAYIIKHNRRVSFAFGERFAASLSLFLQKHVSGIAANFSLGFLLGMTPAIFTFIGIGIDVRHVTLSAGSLATALVALTGQPIPTLSLLFAILGIVSMAILNVGVSFALAMYVALRARKIQAPARSNIYREIRKRFKQNPWAFFFPPKTEATSSEVI